MSPGLFLISDFRACRLSTDVTKFSAQYESMPKSASDHVGIPRSSTLHIDVFRQGTDSLRCLPIASLSRRKRGCQPGRGLRTKPRRRSLTTWTFGLHATYPTPPRLSFASSLPLRCTSTCSPPSSSSPKPPCPRPPQLLSAISQRSASSSSILRRV